MAQKNGEKKQVTKRVSGKTYKRARRTHRTRSQNKNKRKQKAAKKKQGKLKAPVREAKKVNPAQPTALKPKPKVKQSPKKLSNWDRIRIEWYRDVIERGEIRGR